MNQRYQFLESLYKLQAVEVCKCFDIQTNKLVCIKYLKVQDIEDLKYMFNEIMVLFSLNQHEYFLKIIDFNLIPSDNEYSLSNEVERVMIITEFYAKGDLEREIIIRKKQNRYFTEHELMTHFLRLLKAFKVLQEKKLVHRDIKAENIFISDENELIIGDLGSSTVKRETEVTLIGSHYYMSPEVSYHFMQYRGGVGEPRVNYSPLKSDVWSLGVTFYYLITLEKPNKLLDLRNLEQGIKDVLFQIKNPFFQDLISKMLRIVPEDREDFINLCKFLESHLSSCNSPLIPPPSQTESQETLCFSCKKHSNFIECECKAKIHPECLASSNYLCSCCSKNLADLESMFICVSCNKKFPLASLNGKCNHKFCLECKAKNYDCLNCLGFRLFSSKPEGFEELYMLSCPTDGITMSRREKTLVCNTHGDYRICIVCKSPEHNKSCVSVNSSNRIFCVKCGVLTYRDPFCFLFKCINCSESYCYVCLKSTNETSHLKCANLFTWAN
jgi:serine/threonine protein kinase